MTHPYRSPSKRSEDSRDGQLAPERGLFVLVLLLWLASFVRFAAALARGETFGLAACLASLTVFVVPVLLWRARKR
ncbi:MAG: hypothetical protein U0174_07085 [Polyangiaceae bacterium]